MADGVRFTVVRADDPRERGIHEGADILYEGSIETEGERFPLRVRLCLPDGAAQSELDAPSLSEARRTSLSKAASALIRAATRSAVTTGLAVPRKIHRWRAG